MRKLSLSHFCSGESEGSPSAQGGGAPAEFPVLIKAIRAKKTHLCTNGNAVWNCLASFPKQLPEITIALVKGVTGAASAKSIALFIRSLKGIEICKAGANGSQPVQPSLLALICKCTAVLV